MHYKLYTGIALAALVLIFVLQNTVVVDIKLLFWTLSMSRSLLILVVLGIGMLIGALIHSYIVHKRKEEEETPQ